jgi:hypothetical protein
MMIKHMFSKLLSAFLVLSLAAWTLPPQALAGMIGTEEVASSQALPSDRATLVALLERDEVQRQLEAMGVDPADAQARVAALTDDQARDLAARFDELPAGGVDVLGVLFTVAIVLLVTDLLGLTNIYPFMRTRAAR